MLSTGFLENKIKCIGYYKTRFLYKKFMQKACFVFTSNVQEDNI